ncbi:MAG: hypothetical protein QOJ90_1310 [Actinomycetota bacterium]|jgi:uncharacterized membrane protein|nr:hypothetical protein [Actinomycetota bacterium]
MRRAVTVLVVGVAVTLALLAFTPWQLAVIAGWDAAAATFLGSVGHLILRADGPVTEHLATTEDDTRASATVLLAATCVASLLAVGFALGLAGDRNGTARVVLIAVAVATVALSWAVLNSVFTLRYAHLYYGPAAGSLAIASDIPAPPSFRDFAYVAFTVGMTYQISDTAISSPQTRRTVLSQAILAYIFGVVIVAGTINLIAGLVG